MKVHYVLQITVQVEESGAWEDRATIESVMKQALESTNSWQVLLKRGATEPVLVRSQIELKRLMMVPETDERS